MSIAPITTAVESAMTPAAANVMSIPKRIIRVWAVSPS
jgi:hypothetical protein